MAAACSVLALSVCSLAILVCSASSFLASSAAARSAGKSLEDARTEKVLEDLGTISLGSSAQGSPIYLRDVADVRLGSEMRRGVLDWNGEGEAVGDGVGVGGMGER